MDIDSEPPLSKYDEAEDLAQLDDEISEDFE
jgi:hypothetical protein